MKREEIMELCRFFDVWNFVQLSEKTGICVHTVRSWAKGERNPSRRNIDKIEKAKAAHLAQKKKGR